MPPEASERRTTPWGDYVPARGTPPGALLADMMGPGTHNQFLDMAAATQAAGLREMFGGMARIIHAGRAAQNGVSAALLSQRGFVSSDAGIEAEAGFANVLSPIQNWDAMTDGLGSVWETLENTYKPYSTGIVAHPAIDGCIRLRDTHGLKPSDIAKIEMVDPWSGRSVATRTA